MANQMDEIVGNLRSGTEAAFAAIESWATAGRSQELVGLWEAVEARSEGDLPARQPFEATCDQIEETLALTPGDAFAEATLDVARRPRARSYMEPRSAASRLRAIASRLGQGQTKEAFLQAASDGDPSDTELLACWMHEIVLRGTSLDREPEARALRARLESEGHVLAAMPLTLLEAELEAPTYVPLYGPRALQRAIAKLESGATSLRTIPPPEGSAPPKAEVRPDALLEARLVEAVRPWTQGSNGKVEAKVFGLTPHVAPAGAGRWLVRALPIEALANATGLDVQRVEAEAVWGALFSAAANGGAYDVGLGGAYGRRAAWTSLGALVDAPGNAPAAAIDARARACTFLTFSATGPWFFDVAWDIGVAALRPDGASMAVLAATDSD